MLILQLLNKIVGSDNHGHDYISSLKCFFGKIKIYYNISTCFNMKHERIYNKQFVLTKIRHETYGDRIPFLSHSKDWGIKMRFQWHH